MSRRSGPKDIDAVFTARPDHWHAALSIAVLKEGKDVYGRKAMMRVVADGKAVIAAEEPAGRIFQAGSRRVTSAAYRKGGIHSMVAQGSKWRSVN